MLYVLRISGRRASNTAAAPKWLHAPATLLIFYVFLPTSVRIRAQIL